MSAFICKLFNFPNRVFNKNVDEYSLFIANCIYIFFRRLFIFVCCCEKFFLLPFPILDFASGILLPLLIGERYSERQKSLNHR